MTDYREGLPYMLGVVVGARPASTGPAFRFQTFW